MSEPSPYNDYGPITWIKRVPVYVTTVLVALLVLGMFATAFAGSAHADLFLFVFSPVDFWRQIYLWQIFTYPFLNAPAFFFAFSMFFFYWFGTDVERYLGRSRYFVLLILIVAAPPLVRSLLWVIFRGGGISAGCDDLTIGFFIAFATLYPNLELRGWITMKWIAFAGIVLSTMLDLMNRDIASFFTMIATCVVAYGYVRFLQLGADFSVITGVFNKVFKRRPKFKVVPRESSAQDAIHESIDPLLDKIAKSGISSLTAREKAQLERARESLLKKPE